MQNQICILFKKIPHSRFVFKGPAPAESQAPATAEHNGKGPKERSGWNKLADWTVRLPFRIAADIRERAMIVLSGVGYTIVRPITKTAERLGFPEVKNTGLDAVWEVMGRTADAVTNVMGWTAKKAGAIITSPLTMGAEIGRGVWGTLKGAITKKPIESGGSHAAVEKSENHN